MLQAAERAGCFSEFLAAIARAGMSDVLVGPKRHTVFAPTDAAFAKSSKATLVKLKSVPGGAALRAFVAVHLVAGQVSTERLKGRRIRGKSVEGSELVINGAEIITVNGAAIVRPDIAAVNGVWHGIDTMLWPKAAMRQSEVAAGG